MDAKPHRDDRPQGLHRVEREVRREGPALLLPAQPLPSEHSWAARHHPPPAHLHGVPQQLSLDPRSNRRWLQFLIISVSSVSKLILRTEKLLFITSNIFYKIVIPRLATCYSSTIQSKSISCACCTVNSLLILIHLGWHFISLSVLFYCYFVHGTNTLRGSVHVFVGRVFPTEENLYTEW